MYNTDKTVRGSFTIRTGRKSLMFFSFTALALIATAVFLVWPGANQEASASARLQANNAGGLAEMFNQVVRLNQTGGYGVYGSRGVTATGDNSFRGAVGVGENGQFTGVVDSARGNSDVDYVAIRKELADSYSALRQLPCTTVEDGRLGGKTFGTGFYCVAGNKMDNDLVFDAEGNPDAIMAIRVDGNFEAAAGVHVRLINGAQAFNVHITVDGNALIGAGADIRGSIIAKGNIEVATGGRVKGQVISIEGEVKANGAELGAGTGQIEICKAIAAGTTLPAQNYTFTFAAVGGGTQSVSIPAGVCSAPREVPSIGNLTVTETYTNPATFAISNATATRVGNVPVTGVTFSSPAGTVSVPVLEGDLNNETTLTVTNQPVRGGFIEICKFASAITAPVTPALVPELTTDPVGGIFQFQFVSFPGGATQTVSVPVGGCSLPLLITSFTNSPTQTSFVSTISEVGRTGILLENVTTDPAGRLVSFVSNGIGLGGSANVTINVGDAGVQAIVNFFNRTAPGEIKVCKVAGPGVPVGTMFTFDVAGTIPGGTATAPTFPGALATFPITVQAGPGPEGFCGFVRNAAGTANQTFVVGRRISVTERTLDVANFPTVVSRIDERNAGAPIVENLPARTVAFDVLAGTGVVTFTNIRNQPGSLKVCKVGTGAAANGTFTFDMLPAASAFPIFEDGFNFGSVSVPAGSCSVPQTGFPTDLNILVDERPTAGTVATGITAQPGAGTIVSTNLPLGQGTIDIVPNVTTNEIIFTNGTALTGLRGTDYDFDGDGKADPSIYRPSTGAWWILGSTMGSRTTVFGNSSDIIVPADYDGDGRADYAVYRGGQWHILGSTSGYSVTTFGLPGDIPQAGDYDGDGRADLAVYRPSNGVWYILESQNGFAAVQFGISTDRPVAADFDGDGKYDPAVYRGGVWYVLSSTGGFSAFQFGLPTDIPVQADYDGDGKADAAVYRGGTWYIQRSTAGFTAGVFGIATDKPVPADYDGDHKADIAVFRPSDGVWHIMRSSGTENATGYTSFAFGVATDTPVP